MQAVGQVERFQLAPKESHIKYSPEAWDSPKVSLDFPFSEYKGGVEVDYKSTGQLCVRGS